MLNFMDYTAYHIRRNYEILNGLSNEVSARMLEKLLNGEDRKNFIFPESIAKEYKEFVRKKSKMKKHLKEE